MTASTDIELLARVSPSLQAKFMPLAKQGVRLFDFMGGRRSGKTWFILQKLINRMVKGDIVSVATMTETQGEMGAYADTIDIINGQGQGAASIHLPLQKFTLIGATTRAGQLSAPLRDRFGVILRLELYTPEELSRIVSRSAKILEVPCEPAGALCV